MSPDLKFYVCPKDHRMTKAIHRLVSDGDWVCNVCKEEYGNAPGFEFYQCPTCHDDYCNKDECKQVPERDYSEERKPWIFVPNMETEFLEFMKIEEEPEVDFSDLKEVDLEQAAEVGFITVTGSPPFVSNEDPLKATLRD